MNWTLIERGKAYCRVVVADEAAQGPATELAHYLGELTGTTIGVERLAGTRPGDLCILVCDRAALAAQPEWASEAATLATGGAEAYLIKTVEHAGVRTLLLAGSHVLATWYAVYDLLNTLGVGFFFDEVRVPRLAAVAIPAMHKLEHPAAETRCFKPQVLGDYSRLHSFWFWDQARWEQAIRWCVQNRLNTVHLQCFAGMNWIAYRQFPEARVTNDPVMTTEQRIRMTQHLIRYAHGFGVKVWIGFVTNGATYPYVDAHPEQACTGIGGVYEGDLCGRAGRAFLEAAAAEYFDTYAEADGFVFWPPEGHCHCPECESGKSFVDLVAGYIARLRRQAPDKRILLLDWSLPTEGGALPSDLTMLNMHEFSQLPPYVERGMTTIFDLIVNWDTGSCTTVSPRVHDMHREMLLTHRMGVKGFEAHLVSAFSGELNIQAFATIAWDPERFDPTAFTDTFLTCYYGDGSPALQAAVRELEAVWTPPYNAYTSILVSRFHHWAVPGDAAATCVAEITEYVEQPGKPGAVPVKQHRRLSRADMLALLDGAVAHLAAARAHLGSVATGTEPLRFLKASAEAQWRYAQWTTEKYRALAVLVDAQQAATAGDWAGAQASVAAADRAVGLAREALLQLKALLDAQGPWFQTQRCVAERDLEAWIGTQAVNDEVQDLYASSVIGGRCMPTAGLQKMEALVRDAQAAVQAHVAPRLKPEPQELEPYVRYPRQRQKIIRALRERLAKA
ncbi:MAG: hypothetical protein K8T26_05005 [Lentisphaerae bacterium]|nr:hypothetical protein [Lentisphaerota bacterium]